MTFSVVVISFRQRAFIERLVTQLVDQDYPPDDYEIVVVECASADGTAEWLTAHADSRLLPILLTEPCNRSTARNRGIRESRGEIIVMIDGDHTIECNFLQAHLAAHAGRCCAVVGKSVFADNTEYRAISTYLDGSGAGKLPPNTALPGRYFLTRNCSVPRQVLLDIGLFDESFDRWGGEDLDLGVRLEAQGVPIYGAPQALAVHHHFRTIHEVLRVVEAYGEGSVPRLVEKHPQLFRELNLDWLYPNPYENDRHSASGRTLHRALCADVVYSFVLSIAHRLRRRILPRSVFDYLHLRQYSRGFARAVSVRK